MKNEISSEKKYRSFVTYKLSLCELKMNQPSVPCPHANRPNCADRWDKAWKTPGAITIAGREHRATNRESVKRLIGSGLCFWRKKGEFPRSQSTSRERKAENCIAVRRTTSCSQSLLLDTEQKLKFPKANVSAKLTWISGLKTECEKELRAWHVTRDATRRDAKFQEILICRHIRTLNYQRYSFQNYTTCKCS